MPNVPQYRLTFRDGQTKRSRIPAVSADYQLTAYDRGARILVPGITVTLPDDNPVTYGENYTVVNHSTGTAHIAAPDDSVILLANGASAQSVDFEPGTSRTALRSTADSGDGNWLLAGMGQVMTTQARSGRPIANDDYALLETELGVVMNTAGKTVSLPSYTDFQKGRNYDAKNGSSGEITVRCAPGESILRLGQLVSSVTIPSDLSRQFTRETSTQHWIII